uniref:Uncharacterized protein n=1 Tax=Glossina pallidipes TaxID=7398 RepID=A0A1B0AC79_GLOPL
MFDACEFLKIMTSPRTDKKYSTRSVACEPSSTGPLQIDIPNLETGLPPIDGSAGVPPIELLSVDLVDLASPNPAVSEKGWGLSCDLALRKGKEVTGTLRLPKVSYAKTVKSSRVITPASFGGSGPSTVSAPLDASTSVAPLVEPNG